MNYSYRVVEVRKTSKFLSWLKALRDARPVGEGGVSEMRIGDGPGYRVSFVQRGPQIVVLLCGGDKSSQSADIARAKLLAKEV